MSSPRARAVSGRRCSHSSGEGEDFLARLLFFFFMKTAITRKRKVEKSIPRWEMNRLSEGYKPAVDKVPSGVFSVMWVPKFLFLPAKSRTFGPKKAKYVFFLGTYRPCQLIWCPVGCWLWRAGCTSQDTYLLYLVAPLKLNLGMVLR